MGELNDKISFIATLPPIQSAMNVSGNGDGMRVKLDIPQAEIGNAIRLTLYQNTAFRVTIEPIDDGNADKHRKIHI